MWLGLYGEVTDENITVHELNQCVTDAENGEGWDRGMEVWGGGTVGRVWLERGRECGVWGYA